jgi:hypothetical protein
MLTRTKIGLITTLLLSLILAFSLPADERATQPTPTSKVPAVEPQETDAQVPETAALGDKCSESWLADIAPIPIECSTCVPGHDDCCCSASGAGATCEQVQEDGHTVAQCTDATGTITCRIQSNGRCKCA